MESKSFSILLAILLVTAFALPLTTIAIAKPLDPNPDQSWQSDTIWGTNLTIENTAKTDMSIYSTWWGARTGALYTAPWPGYPPAPTSYVGIWILNGGVKKGQVIETQVPSPQSYSYIVQAEGDGAGDMGWVSWKLENATHDFVPPDFSAVLDNGGAGIFINLRAKDNEHMTLPWSSTLYVDNAVNIENFENTTSLVAEIGQTVSFAFDIVNTGRYADNYALSANAGAWVVGNWSPDDNAALGVGESLHVTFDVTVGSSQDINVEADGDYASDNSPVLTASEAIRDVQVTATPPENADDNGVTVTFNVAVKNTGDLIDNYDLTVDNVWAAWLSSILLSDVVPNETRNVTLSVTIPGNAVYCNRDNVTVIATSDGDPAVKDNDTVSAHCVAGVAFDLGPIDPAFQEDWPGQTLFYKVAIANIGATADTYDVTLTDTKGWNLYFTDITPIDDSYVNQYYPTSPQGVGYHAYHFYVGADYHDWTSSMRTYLKFDLSWIPAGSTITSATLYANAKYGMSGPGYAPDNLLVNAVNVDNDAWDETTITWNNAPPMGPTVFDSTLVKNSSEVGQYYWWSWNVTSLVQNEFAGDKVASIGLIADNENKAVDGWFYSKDDAYWPYLEVIFSPQTSSVEVTVPAGENVIVSFRVDIPNNAPVSTIDLITVTAVSQTDNMISDSENGTAHVKSLVEVNVEITPGEQTATAHTVDVVVNPSYRYDPITYKVAVTNEGLLDDKYELTVEDTADPDWGLKVDPAELFVPAGDTEYASLSVTVPEWAVAGDTDTITVTAVGKMASFLNVGIMKPIDDSYVNLYYPTSPQGVGYHSYHFYVGADYHDWTSPMRAYLKFDLSWIPAGSTITSATLYANAKYGMSGAGYAPDNVLVNAVNVDNDAWDETTITWNNAPPMGPTVFDSTLVKNSSEVGQYYWWSWNVTSLAQNEFAGDKVASIGLIADNENQAADGWFYSKDDANDTYHPYLEVIYSVLPATDSDSAVAIAGLAHGIQIEVLPDEIEPQTGAPGSPLAWLVVIKNTGNAPNEFNLSVGEVLEGTSSDSALRTEWGATLDDNFFALSQSTKATTYLRVTVPDDAKTSEWDSITVKVTKVENEEVTDNVTVKAHALEPGPRIPEGVVEIAVEAEVIAIDVWPTQYDFGVIDELDVKETGQYHFTIRNVGNVDEEIWARGTDAQSMPGEPVTTWTLSTVPGVDAYTLTLKKPVATLISLETIAKQIWSSVSPSEEVNFGLRIQAPSAIITPARMWARVKLTAIAA